MQRFRFSYYKFLNVRLKTKNCTATGTGEDIMRYSLARRLVERVVKEPLEHIDAVLKQEFEAFSGNSFVDMLFAFIFTLSDQCTLFDREPSGGVLLLIKEAMSEDFRNESVALMASPEYFGTADSKSMEDISKKDVTKLRLWCAFTTQSMSVGFQSSEMAKPKVMHFPLFFQSFSRVPPGHGPQTAHFSSIRNDFATSRRHSVSSSLGLSTYTISPRLRTRQKFITELLGAPIAPAIPYLGDRAEPGRT